MEILPSIYRIFLLDPAESFGSGKIYHRIHIIYHFQTKERSGFAGVSAEYGQNQQEVITLDTSTAAYRILEITAISGELPCDTLSWTHIGESYGEKLVTRLKEDRLIKTHCKGELRGYRLTSRGRKLFLAQNPERFSFCLTGSSDTDQPRNDYPRRLRLHQASRTYCLMLGAGITTFRDKKLALFSGVLPGDTHILPLPVFYQSRELEELGMEATRTNNSRAIGILLTESLIFPVFYTGSTVVKWEYKTEIRPKTLLSHHITQGVLSDHYRHRIPIHALFTNSNMETAVKLIASTGGIRHSLFALDTSFGCFRPIPDGHASEILLKVLCSPTIDRQLTVLFLSDLETVSPPISMEHDAVQMGQLVLLAYDFDMLRISRFITALKLQRRTGRLICFGFQKEALLLYCGDTITISTIDLTKFERRFFS